MKIQQGEALSVQKLNLFRLYGWIVAQKTFVNAIALSENNVNVWLVIETKFKQILNRKFFVQLQLFKNK